MKYKKYFLNLMITLTLILSIKNAKILGSYFIDNLFLILYIFKNKLEFAKQIPLTIKYGGYGITVITRVCGTCNQGSIPCSHPRQEPLVCLKAYRRVFSL